MINNYIKKTYQWEQNSILAFRELRTLVKAQPVQIQRNYSRWNRFSTQNFCQNVGKNHMIYITINLPSGRFLRSNLIQSNLVSIGLKLKPALE